MSNLLNVRVTIRILVLLAVVVLPPSWLAAQEEPIVLTMGPDELIWTAPAGETSYDVVQGDLQTLRATGGAYIPATRSCAADDHTMTSLLYPDVPVNPGEGFWFLVRGEVSTLGYDTTREYDGGSQLDGRDGEINVAADACPEYRCAADIPAVYDQVNTIAGGVCVEALQIVQVDGPPACPETDYVRADGDMELIKEAYPFTRSVEAPIGFSCQGQVFDPGLDVILCAWPAGVTLPETIFDELNACYRATSRCLFRDPVTGLCGQVWPEFDWMVRVTDLLEIYEEVVSQQNVDGWCELDPWFGQPPGPQEGFHATNLGDGNWRWLVRATDQCGGGVMRCDGWVMVVISETGEMTEEELVNNSFTTGPDACVGDRWTNPAYW